MKKRINRSPTDLCRYTLVVQRDGRWWIGWIEEVPGVNGQGRTRHELLASLRCALQEALAINREEP